MPRFIMKVDPDPADDRYVEWSTVVDNIVWVGTRSELAAHAYSEGWAHIAEDRIARTDRVGTSALWNEEDTIQDGAYADTHLVVTNVQGRDGVFRLNRADLGAFAAGDLSVLTLLDGGDG